MLVQIGDIGIAHQKPQQLVDDRLDVDFLGRHQRKTKGQIETQLSAEYGERTGAGAVRFADAVVANMAHEIEVLLHARIITRF